MCAGITTFNALRHSGAGPGDLVAIQGIGGLGHLGVQFAAKSGYDTVAIGRGEDKEALALKLGARRYIDTGTQDVAAELTKEGGALNPRDCARWESVRPTGGWLGREGKIGNGRDVAMLFSGPASS